MGGDGWTEKQICVFWGRALLRINTGGERSHSVRGSTPETLGGQSTSPSPQFCSHHVPTSRARSGPQPRQVLTFLFVVGDIFQQLSLHAGVFPCLSLTQHCSLGAGREGTGGEKKEISWFSSMFIHTLHLKEETIMDTSCLHHGQTSFCKITLPGNCHQGTGQR